MSAQEILDYLAGHTITQGEGTGQPIQIMPWEADFILGAFRRGVTNSALSVARGNGKTTLISAIGTAVLEGPLVQSRAECIIVASSFEQSRINFEHCLAFLEEKYPDLYTDKARWRIQDSANRAHITDKKNRTRIKCIGSDPSRAHGLAGLIYVLDEPAQWPRNTRDRMLAAIRTARGKMRDTRLFALGTQSNDDSHWFQRMLGGSSDYAQLHAAPKDCDPFDRANWLLANPSLPYFPALEEIIRSEAEDAKKDPAMLPAFKALRLNQGTSDVETRPLIDPDVWLAAEGDRPPSGDLIFGIDLGDGKAMSAITAFWEGGRLDSLAAFPDHPPLPQRSLQDGVGEGDDSLYVKMFERGELLLCPGHVVDVTFLLNEAYKRWGQPAAIVADRWKERELVQSLSDSQIAPRPIIFRGQGFKDGSEDVRYFRKGLLKGRVTPCVNLLLRSAMRESVVLADPAGNEKLAKASEAGRRKLARDDAAAAAILAVAAVERKRAEQEDAFARQAAQNYAQEHHPLAQNQPPPDTPAPTRARSDW